MSKREGKMDIARRKAVRVLGIAVGAAAAGMTARIANAQQSCRWVSGTVTSPGGSGTSSTLVCNTDNPYPGGYPYPGGGGSPYPETEANTPAPVAVIKPGQDSPDARCNPEASDATKRVVATSSAEDKWLGAQNLFTQVRLANGVKALKNSGLTVQRGAFTVPLLEFEAIWTDGSSSTYFVAAGYAGLLQPILWGGANGDSGSVAPPVREKPAGSVPARCGTSLPVATTGTIR